MCGRFCLYSPLREIAERYGIIPGQPELPFDANYNGAPAQYFPVIIKDGNALKMRLMRWGLVPSWSDGKNTFDMINIRSETVSAKPYFKRLSSSKRCIVPFNGFFEWKNEAGRKFPFLIKPNGSELSAFAGVYDHWSAKEGGIEVYSFSIFTMPANADMSLLHDRMPVIIGSDIRSYLEGGVLLDDAVNRSGATRLIFSRVSDQMNKPSFNNPDVIKSIR
jgi:putative SOS response-associated peptidase YedK